MTLTIQQLRQAQASTERQQSNHVPVIHTAIINEKPAVYGGSLESSGQMNITEVTSES